MTDLPQYVSLNAHRGDHYLGPGPPPPHQPSHSGAPSISRTTARPAPIGDYGLGVKGDEKRYDDVDIAHFMGELDPEVGTPKTVEKKDVPRSRQLWVAFVWAVTAWIPSPLLRYIGQMKRPDIRLAWREKFVLFLLIILANAAVIFWIVGLDYILCPNRKKVWSVDEVSLRNTENKYWVAIHGKVYDITDWWRVQHSDISGRDTTADVMMPLAGLDLTQYFMPPWSLACPGLVGENDNPPIVQNTTRTPDDHPEASHTSGSQANPSSKLHDDDWYTKYFQPKIKQYYKGYIVIKKKDIVNDAQNNDGFQFMMNRNVYDMTSYFYTNQRNSYSNSTAFLPSAVSDMLKENPGKDITHLWQDGADWQNTLNCMNNAFYAGKVDFRDEPKCTVLNYILLAFAILICMIIVAKFLSALQLGSKRRPAMQDKFVICQVPAYTEGEDQIRKGLDSLTALHYDNKRKLIWVICDGMIVGGGNDRPTPKIVLDILGVDPKIDPPALPFESIGVGSEQLNYGKVYSGLYEYEGNVVPYVVTVKVGKESEQNKSKPGNRGKRDSQMLVMKFLNRVHFRSPMSPLELETFHQINNIIGVDPELYEYVLMVDADTSVKEDSLNRLVAACANDAKIVGICGETSLDNEGKSWWTMIQVYEYYISHHLAKAFESLFGSVTCLPGCFCMYRLRTADKGKPLIISDEIIKDYSDCEVDTLHKKNLLSLGEDRFLTTIMLKHFPKSRFKFVPNALALTAAPEQWSVLLSQRRRWINSTVHNLFELVWIDDLCGFCMFSMRFVVFVDLVGTIILPATVVYLVYLII
ncbi:F-actin-capping protein subunit alpha, partial [Ascosphaera pollenicola]